MTLMPGWVQGNNPNEILVYVKKHGVSLGFLKSLLIRRAVASLALHMYGFCCEYSFHHDNFVWRVAFYVKDTTAKPDDLSEEWRGYQPVVPMYVAGLGPYLALKGAIKHLKLHPSQRISRNDKLMLVGKGQYDEVLK